MNCRTAELPKCRIEERKPRRTVGQWLRLAGKTALAALREIFDENAYARFLARHALPPSRAAYAAFMRENSAARERRPRCC